MLIPRRKNTLLTASFSFIYVPCLSPSSQSRRYNNTADSSVWKPEGEWQLDEGAEEELQS